MSILTDMLNKQSTIMMIAMTDLHYLHLYFITVTYGNRLSLLRLLFTVVFLILLLSFQLLIFVV